MEQSAQAPTEPSSSRSGWLLKKSKTDRPWSKAHHSHRYFVSRGHALCYYEAMVDSHAPANGLRGVIDLRQLKRLRPTGASACAPEKKNAPVESHAAAH